MRVDISVPIALEDKAREIAVEKDPVGHERAGGRGGPFQAHVCPICRLSTAPNYFGVAPRSFFPQNIYDEGSRVLPTNCSGHFWGGTLSCVCSENIRVFPYESWRRFTGEAPEQ